jgi:hypothetical protein
VIHTPSVRDHHHRHRQARWLHTRISEPLEDALKREAQRRRLPVSLLVRHVLEGALDLVEGIVESGMRVPRRADRPQGASNGLTDVYGWQELILNRADACARCGTGLASGVKAYRGLRDRTGPAVFLCVPCIRRLRAPEDNRKEEPR